MTVFRIRDIEYIREALDRSDDEEARRAFERLLDAALPSIGCAHVDAGAPVSGYLRCCEGCTVALAKLGGTP